MNQVTCIHCGWVHFTVTREHAEEEVRRFNEFYDAAPAHVKECYSQHSSIAQYESCFLCGAPWHDMRPYREGDCPIGVTMQPIIEA